MIIQVISAFFATAAFSVLFYIPKKYIVRAGITGGLGWFIYLVLLGWNGDKAFANLGATLIVALLAHIMARIYKTPVTMFLIPGIIPLVPGAGMYEIVLSILNNEIGKTNYNLIVTLKMAGAIALGIFVIDTIFRSIKEKKKAE